MNNCHIFAFADEASAQIPGQIAAMKRNGLQGLEIRGVDGTNVSGITLEKAKEIRRQLDDNGLVTWSIGSPIGKIRLAEDFSAHLDTFRHLLEVANILGAGQMRIFSFYTDTPEADRNHVLDNLSCLLEAAKGSGVLLCHENEKGIYGDTARRCLDLLDTLPELQGVFDPANFIQCGENPLDDWQLLKHRIRYLHIKDALADGNIVPSGSGIGSIPHIVRDYLAMGGSAMTLEPHLTVFDGLKNLEESGSVSIVGQRYTFENADAAFDAACAALNQILQEIQ